MKTPIAVVVAVLFAGCVTEKKEIVSFDSPTPFSVGRFEAGSNRGKEDHSASFYVQQGYVFRYRVAARGVPVRITVCGGMPGKEKMLDQKEGLVFESTFVPEFTGLAYYVIEVTASGISKGEVVPLTKPHSVNGAEPAATAQRL